MRNYLAYVRCHTSDLDWGTKGQQAICGVQKYNKEEAEEHFRRYIPGNWEVIQVIEHTNFMGIWHLATGRTGV